MIWKYKALMPSNRYIGYETPDKLFSIVISENANSYTIRDNFTGEERTEIIEESELDIPSRRELLKKRIKANLNRIHWDYSTIANATVALSKSFPDYMFKAVLENGKIVFGFKTSYDDWSYTTDNIEDNNITDITSYLIKYLKNKVNTWLMTFDLR